MFEKWWNQCCSYFRCWIFLGQILLDLANSQDQDEVQSVTKMDEFKPREIYVGKISAQWLSRYKVARCYAAVTHNSNWMKLSEKGKLQTDLLQAFSGCRFQKFCISLTIGIITLVLLGITNESPGTGQSFVQILPVIPKIGAISMAVG